MAAARSAPSGTPVRQLLSGRFGWFFAGRAVDLAGSSMTVTALALAVLQASGSPADLGVVLAADLLPTLVLLLIGGSVADRVSRRTLLMGCSLLSAASMAGMAGLLLTDRYTLPGMAALSLANGVIGAFSSPALRGLVPELIAPSDLQRANALLATTQNAVRITGAPLASIIVAAAGGGWALAVDAVSFLVAALLFSRIPRGVRPPAADEPL